MFKSDHANSKKVTNGSNSNNKAIIALAIALGCFAILMPKIMLPMFEGSVSSNSKTTDLNDGLPSIHPAFRVPLKKGSHFNSQRDPKFNRPPRENIEEKKKSTKDGGIMALFMPVYTTVIIVFFAYTLIKLLTKNNDLSDDKLDEKIYPNLKMDAEYRKYLLQEKYDDDGRSLDNFRKKKFNSILNENNEIARLKDRLRTTELQLEKMIEQFQNLNKGFLETTLNSTLESIQAFNQTNQLNQFNQLNCDCVDCIQNIEISQQQQQQQNNEQQQNINQQNVQLNQQISKHSNNEELNEQIIEQQKINGQLEYNYVGEQMNESNLNESSNQSIDLKSEDLLTNLCNCSNSFESAFKPFKTQLKSKLESTIESTLEFDSSNQIDQLEYYNQLDQLDKNLLSKYLDKNNYLDIGLDEMKNEFNGIKLFEEQTESLKKEMTELENEIETEFYFNEENDYESDLDNRIHVNNYYIKNDKYLENDEYDGYESDLDNNEQYDNNQQFEKDELENRFDICDDLLLTGNNLTKQLNKKLKNYSNKRMLNNQIDKLMINKNDKLDFANRIHEYNFNQNSINSNSINEQQNEEQLKEIIDDNHQNFNENQINLITKDFEKIDIQKSTIRKRKKSRKNKKKN